MCALKQIPLGVRMQFHHLLLLRLPAVLREIRQLRYAQESRTHISFEVGAQVTREIKALSEVFPRYLWRDAGMIASSPRIKRMLRNAGIQSVADMGLPCTITSVSDVLVGWFEEGQRRRHGADAGQSQRPEHRQCRRSDPDFFRCAVRYGTHRHGNNCSRRLPPTAPML